MKPNIVVDVGNSRIKWARPVGNRVEEDHVSLAPESPESWQEQIKLWNLRDQLVWAVAGVHPKRIGQFTDWLNQRGDQVLLIHDRKLLPIKIDVDEPDRVGIDRLLNAVGARDRQMAAESIVIIDAGSAVTVDWVDKDGVFRGGAIFPGLQMMAKALHDYTAALPLVEVNRSTPRHVLPGNSTELAIRGGVFWAVAGGITALTRLYAARTEPSLRPVIYLTGGDAQVLLPLLPSEVKLTPTLTLEGIRIAAEALP
jgi:type III pantothenate kinase